MFSFFRMLRPNPSERKDILVSTLADILVKVGDGSKVILALNSYKNCFEINSNDVGAKKTNYIADNLTERVINIFLKLKMKKLFFYFLNSFIFN